MPVVGVVGGQWGDEGKGKVVDLLAGDADVVIRAHGGDNAGHTVVNEQGEFALHLVPAGIFNPRATCIIAPGVALNPAVLIQELDALERRGVSTRSLLVSERAHMVLPYHLLIDQVQEARRGNEAIGTTGRGIGPAYGDKVERIGLRVGDLRDLDGLRQRLRVTAEHKNRLFAVWDRSDRISLSEIEDQCAVYRDRLLPYIGDVAPVVADAVARDASVLLEGAHGTLLDLDHGTYPFATSSSCTVAGLCQGAGIPPRSITHAVGVFKAYSTRVGSGPMPTELLDETGSYLREHAHEFGTTTGRARRCGWFDAVSARYSARINGFDSVAVTRLDILDELSVINLCVSYELDGRRVDSPPSDPALLSRCVPVYEQHPGWLTSLCEVKRFDALPENAARFVRRIEEMVEAPADIVGVGPARSQTISRRSLWDTI
ncbi:MAG TPA: adenylosuccinate synthase [Chloroflexota bacterium]|nr:adenylosuccinate synthase [Chloroflexota bacterium]